MLRPFAEIVAGHRAALAWLATLGVASPRFEAALDDLEALDGILRGHGGRMSLRQALPTIQESRDLQHVHQAFRDRSEPALVDVLKKAADGPEAGEPEPSTGRTGRNFMAELTWAAILEGTGHPVRFGGEADAVLPLPYAEAESIVWEVKRPHGKGPDGVLRDAGRQLRKRATKPQLGTTPIGGFPVVFLDRLLAGQAPANLYEKDLREPEFLRHDLSAWVKQHRKTIRRRCDKAGVLGAVFYWRPVVVCWDQNDGTPTFLDCSQLFVDLTVGVSIPNGHRAYVHRLLNGLRRNPPSEAKLTWG